MLREFGLATLVYASTALGLASEPIQREKYKEWTIYSDQTLLGSCHMERSWPDGRRMFLGRNRGRENIRLFLYGQKLDILPQNSRSFVAISFDQNPPTRYQVDRNGLRPEISLEFDETQLLKNIEERNTLLVQYKGFDIFNAHLGGTKVAWSMVDICQQKF